VKERRQPEKPMPSESLLRALSGRDVQAQGPMVARTRRAIRIADQERRDKGAIRRRSLGIALFTLGALLLLVAPVLWNTIEDLIGGEHLGDLPMQITLLSTCLTMSVVAALIILWRSHDEQGGFRH